MCDPFALFSCLGAPQPCCQPPQVCGKMCKCTRGRHSMPIVHDESFLPIIAPPCQEDIRLVGHKSPSPFRSPRPQRRKGTSCDILSPSPAGPLRPGSMAARFNLPAVDHADLIDLLPPISKRSRSLPPVDELLSGIFGAQNEDYPRSFRDHLDGLLPTVPAVVAAGEAEFWTQDEQEAAIIAELSELLEDEGALAPEQAQPMGTEDAHMLTAAIARPRVMRRGRRRSLCRVSRGRLSSGSLRTRGRNSSREPFQEVTDMVPPAPTPPPLLAIGPGCIPGQTSSLGGRSWDWPLSRLERKTRVLMLDHMVMQMDRNELLDSLQKLQNSTGSRPPFRSKGKRSSRGSIGSTRMVGCVGGA